MENMNKEDLDLLTQEVENATKEYNKIYSKDEIIRENKKEFTEHLINAFTNQYKERFDGRSQKLIKTLFNKLLLSRINVDTEDGEKNLKAGFIRKRVEDMVMLIYAYRYLKYNEITKIFNEYGVKIEFAPIEDNVSYLAGTNFKETMKDFIEQSVELKIQKDNIEYDIKENIYSKIPTSLRYNKDSNKTGITKNTFKKFSLLNLLKKINPFKAQKKCQDMTENANIKAKSDILAISIADTIVSTKDNETNESTNA